MSTIGCGICRQARFSRPTYTCQRLAVSRTGLRAVFTANLHVSAASCVTCWLTRSFHGQRTRVNGWLCHVLAYAQFSRPTYTCQRLAVSRVGLRAVFTANVHVSAAGCVTCWLTRGFQTNVHVSTAGYVTCWLTRGFYVQSTRVTG
jgi:hypothetical protein